MRLALPLTAALALSSFAAAPHASAQQPDKYLYLEDVSSPASVAWVKSHDAATAKVFESDPHYPEFYQQALTIAEDPARLPIPNLKGSTVYNSWRDAQNPRGILRSTTLADYNTATPTWHTVIDFDALGKQESVSWIPHGLNCLYPGNTICLVTLSAGGEDAATEREFDLRKAAFVPATAKAFISNHSKQAIAWQDADTLLIARDWGPGTLTASGYPFIVKQWKRGTPVESAKEIYRGQPADIRASATVLNDAEGNSLTVFERGLDFFSTEYTIQTPKGLQILAIPGKSQPTGLLAGRVLVEIREDWTPAGSTQHFKGGSLVSMNLKDVLADPAHLKPAIVFEPTTQEFIDEVRTTANTVLITTLNHVQGGASVYTPTASGWSRKRLEVPANSTVGIADASTTDDTFFLTVTSFLTPSSLLIGNAAKATLNPEKSQPARFDAALDTVEQLEATSKDGTRVPYFVVHRKAIKYDGTNPTLLYAYGGFEVSETPRYSATMGKLWLEHGGVYVLANIRGGGEFGPAWHEAGLKTHRQRIYDDFASVAQDLIARKITSPRHLGIEGGSNGGLLMGVEMTQHPDLWNAVVIEVPLLDMLRFEHIAAGASWVGEYGSVTKPDEQKFLAGISPYEQLKPNVKYPEPFIFTTTKDDRVGPQHARKFAARMEEFHEPFYYDEILEGGHGSGADLKQTARTNAETFVYLTRKLM